MRSWKPFAVSCLLLSGAPDRVSAAEGRAAELWSDAKLSDVRSTAALRRALRGAAHRLAEPRCRRVLSDFRDRRGRPLGARLSELGVSAPDYLRRLAFREGWGKGQCEKNDWLAFTRVGARTVWVCGGKFEFTLTTNARWAEATLIHEALHTLGLEETPSGPTSSLSITRRVLERCGD